MVEDRNGDTPPGQDGVHQGGQHPGSEEIPNFGRLVLALFGCEQTGDPGKVDPTKGDRENRSPGDAHEFKIAEHVCEGEVGGAVIEDLESEQGDHNQTTEKDTALDLNLIGKHRKLR